MNPETVIGFRTPDLRKLAKEVAHTPEAAEFLQFLPYVDNWATCNLISPKIFKKHLPELYAKIKVWLKSGRTYTVRFGIGMLMSFYLDDDFQPEILELVADIRSDEYYVNMIIAWYFATALRDS